MGEEKVSDARIRDKMLSAVRMIIMNSISPITSTEADVSDSLDQLDEAVSGLASGKLNPDGFTSHTHIVTQHRNLQGSKEDCKKNLMLKAYANMQIKTGFQP